YGVVGATGTVSFAITGSSSTPPAQAFTTVTDSSGTIGLSSGLYYYVSHTAGDSAQVQLSAQVGASVIVSTTGIMTTTGGTTRKLSFISPPVSETAGKTFLNIPAFALERFDDFNNPTSLSNVNVVLDDSSNGQIAVHAGRGFSSSNHDF